MRRRIYFVIDEDGEAAHVGYLDTLRDARSLLRILRRLRPLDKVYSILRYDRFSE